VIVIVSFVELYGVVVLLENDRSAVTSWWCGIHGTVRWPSRTKPQSL